MSDIIVTENICKDYKLGTHVVHALVDVNLRDGPSGPVIARQLANGFGTKIVYVTASSSDIGEPAPPNRRIMMKNNSTSRPTINRTGP